MLQDGFLEGLPSPARDIVAAARTTNFERGDALFLAGDRAASAFLVTRGVVKLTQREAEGREAILAICFSGRVIGSTALLLGRSHSHDALGASRGTAVVLPAATFERLMASGAGAARAIAVEQARYTERVEAAAAERTSKVSARVAGRLLDLADAIGTDGEKGRYVQMPMPFADLARLSASSRETVSKTLHGFRREGLIDFRGRTLRIQRPDVLQMIRCGARVSIPSRSTDGEGRPRSGSRSAS